MRIKSIIFEVPSERTLTSYAVGSVTKLDDEAKAANCIKDIELNIIGSCGEPNDEVDIGFISGTFIDVVASMKNDIDLIDGLYVSTARCDEIYELLYDKAGYLKSEITAGLNWNCFFINELFLEKKYRNQGIGMAVLTNLDSALGQLYHFDPGHFFLVPKPIERLNGGAPKSLRGKIKDESYVKKVSELEDFIRKLGFKPYGNKGIWHVNSMNNLKYDAVI